MRLHMNHNMPSGSDLHIVKAGTHNKSLSIDQLHEANNIYNIYTKRVSYMTNKTLETKYLNYLFNP